MVQTYAICTKDHATESCPSLLGLKIVYKEAKEETELVYLLNQHANGKHDKQVCLLTHLLSFNPRNKIHNNTQELCGRSSHLFLIGHNNHSLCHLGPTNQIKSKIGQIPVTFHHSSRIMHIHLNGHPPLHKTRVTLDRSREQQIHLCINN